MTDQATVLRGLMKQRSAAGSATAPQSPAATGARAGARGIRTIAVTSGKGGVGKSVVALNLAVALAQLNQRVCLLDANLALGNIDLLCGLNGYWNLSHVITGARRLHQVVLQGPAGVDIVPGASGLNDIADCPAQAQRDLLTQLGELEQSHDFLILDTGTGIHGSVRRFVCAADVALVLTTPELTSIANAYATLKSLSGQESVELRLLVNRSASSEQAARITERLQQTSRTFLKYGVDTAGPLPEDPAVVRSVAGRMPALLSDPDSPFASAIGQLAHQIDAEPAICRRREPFFARLMQDRQPLTAESLPAGMTASAG